MKIPFSIIPAALAALSIQNSIHAAPLISESFDYVAGTTITGQGGAVDGWAGAWATSGGTNEAFETGVAGLTFGDLEVAGGASQRSARFRTQAMSREISSAAQAALTADGSTIWFSVLMQGTAPTDPVGDGGFATNSYGTLIFGSDPLTEGNGNEAAPITGGASAIGVSFADTSDNLGIFDNLQIQGVTYNAGTLTQGLDNRIVVGGSTPILVVGRVDWAANGSDDVLNLYQITDLTAALPEPFVTMIDDLDQSTFDVISIGDPQTSVFDEIRFGLSLDDVIGELPETVSLSITNISYDDTTEPGNILLRVTFTSEIGKTYSAFGGSDLDSPLLDRIEINDGIIGEEGTTTFVVNFDDLLLDKTVSKFFVVVDEN